jgi:hypothetical protein
VEHLFKILSHAVLLLMLRLRYSLPSTNVNDLMNNQQPLTTLAPFDFRFLKFSIVQNPGNLYVSDSEESSEDDDLDDHEEAFSSPGGRALSPEVSILDIVIEYAVLKHCNIEHGPGATHSA